MESDPTPVPADPKTSRYIFLAVLILSLIVLLFQGTRAWFMGSHRAECVLNARNLQQAVRSHQGMNSESVGDTINWSEIIGPGKFYESKPRCPAGGEYTFSKVHPEMGKLVCKCSHADHLPPDHHTW